MRELIESVAFEARQEKKIDKRSGVSQRMPITCLEDVVSNAERRALLQHDSVAVPRPADLYAAVPSLTGKFELEYEGEMRGADNVARDVIRQATSKIFRKYFDSVPLQPVVQYFELGGTLKYPDHAPTDEIYSQFKDIQGLLDKTEALGISPHDDHALLVAGAEFILEGLYALKKISRNEEVGFHAEHRRAESQADASPPLGPRRRPLN